MKPPQFVYHDPDTLSEAVNLLARLENARPLAGGQSLMPMLNMRYAFPDHLVDLNGVPELSYLLVEDGVVDIGAMTRQRALERSEVIRRHCPLLQEALCEVGHVQTRNRGTLGGSLCHLDPAAELPVVASALDATVSVTSTRGTRSVPMSAFPAFYMTPAIEPDELVTGVRFTPWSAAHGHAFVEFARRRGDFAIVAVAILLERTGDASISRVRITLGGVGPTPVRCTAAEDLLLERGGGEGNVRAAAEVCAEIEATGDVHAPAGYRRHLASVLVRRALERAWARATPG